MEGAGPSSLPKMIRGTQRKEKRRRPIKYDENGRTKARCNFIKGKIKQTHTHTDKSNNLPRHKVKQKERRKIEASQNESCTL